MSTWSKLIKTVKIYDIAEELEKDKKYTVSVYGNIVYDYPIEIWLSESCYVGEIVDNTSTFQVGIIGCTQLIIKSMSASSIEKIKLENGNKAMAWTPALEDVQADIDDKANQSDLNAVEENIGDLTGGLQNKADASQLQSLQDAYDTRMQSLSEREEQTITDIQNLNDRTTALDMEFGAKKVNWDFLENNIQFGEEGILLSTKYVLSTDAEGNEIAVPVDGNTETGVLITKDKIAFIDGGEEIASITGQVMKINHGIFVQSAQIGKHKIETLPDSDITVVTFVG